MLVYGTVTVTVTSIVPCPTTTVVPPAWVTTTQYTTECDECRPVTTCYTCEPGDTTTYLYSNGPTTVTAPPPQQQPVTTITSGTVVYIVYGSTAAAAGQVTTNGVVQVISASSARRSADLMNAGMATALAVLAVLALVVT
jgi:hypothetical protein